ncbi:MAG TPA: ribosome small subunit-dependent GTPase A [Bacteriovoracaceae bacterium]|nr:ribosome small subunit-dependent GTPase A [Bacteriovoracaceae bacterium]
MSIKARIFRSSKRNFDCQREDTKELVVAAALAALLKEDHIVVGDWVDLTPPPKNDDEWVITKVYPRKNGIFRNIPRENKKKFIASNVDVMLVVVSAGRPAYKRGLVDRYLIRSEFWDVPAYVVFNKMDLYDEAEFDLRFEADRLNWLNVECFEISAQQDDYQPRFLENGMKELREKLRGKTSVFLGHSGVGKSKLITELSGGKVNLLSGELGKIGKGAHTTTWAELIDAEHFTLIDSPGVRSMSLSDLTKEELLQSFCDIQEFATKCQFASNCGHAENSKGCFFEKLDKTKRENQLILSRLDSYKRVLEEVADIPDWQKKPSER